MKDIAEYDEYRLIIEALTKHKKINYREICLKTRIHTSYFSRVMVGKANFSQEQMYLVAEILDIKDWRLDYFLLLAIKESSGNSMHLSFINKKIEALKEKHHKLVNRLENVKDQKELSDHDRRDYYQKSITAVIHMYLTVEKYRDNQNLILKKLNISKKQLQTEISKLETLGIIEIKKDKIFMKQFSVQLSEKDPISPHNHINWRLESINRIKNEQEDLNDYHFSAVFSTDYNSKNKIKELFKKFIVEAQKEASKFKNDEEVFAITFDLF